MQTQLDKEALEKRFHELLKKDSVFSVRVLEWINFITEMITQYKMKSTDATDFYKLNTGWPTWNDNDKIIPSLGGRFKKSLEKGFAPDRISSLMLDIRLVDMMLTLLDIYRDSKVRLIKISSTLLSEFLIHADFNNSMDMVTFLLNVPEADFLWLQGKTNQKPGKVFLDKKELTQNFKEQFMKATEDKNEHYFIEKVMGYPFKFPEKETLYGWVVEQWSSRISTKQLEKFVDETRSIALGRELLKRPNRDVGLSVFLTQIKESS